MYDEGRNLILKIPNLTFQLIYEIPENTQAENESRCWIQRCSEIVLFKSKTILVGDGIDIFQSDKTGKTPDSEVVV